MQAAIYILFRPFDFTSECFTLTRIDVFAMQIRIFSGKSRLYARTAEDPYSHKAKQEHFLGTH